MTADTQATTNTQKTITGWLILTIIGITMASVQYGYNFGVINSPERLIRKFMKESQYRRQGSHLSDDTTRILWALTVSIFAIGGCCGGFFAGRLATKFGRKYGCLVNTSLGIVASSLMFLSRSVDSLEVIVVGRFLLGCHCGIYNGLVPMYLSEISTPGIRGGVGVVHQLGIVIGILSSQILGFPEFLGTENKWDILLGLAAVPCVLQALILPFCPESPRYLLINRKDEEKCKQALMLLRGSEKIDEEILEIKQEMSSCSPQRVSILQLFQNPSFRRPVLTACVLQISLHFSGMGGIFFYSTSLFRFLIDSHSLATYTTSAVGGAMMLMSIINILLIDRLGRRTLQLTGFGGIVICATLLTITFIFKNQVGWFPVASIVFILLYVIFLTLGPASVTWPMSAELFSHDARPAGLSVCVLVNSASSFTVGFIFPILQNAIQDYTFLPFAVLNLMFFLFTFFFIQETKGKTFEEVTAMYQPASKTNPSSEPDKESE